ncbi:MAG: 3-oxoacyl-ACP synthase [Winogradskyella sp.]|uniref:3-oxoacyl-ACP synthase n=1 Tax=Winogradskyella sp. TaxID=1883156 RepID=UPI0025CDAF25|nr:3-oxoacyl-ACP synthase [Winogradskyella sp.]NRB59632.1 3-oxoacyl-ACP synthase [Winogradskyella sp.]
MTVKQQLHQQCETFLNKRLEVIQNTISDIEKALTSETKSTAGDKHETGRAMLQLEREKAGQQLAELQKQFLVLNKINISQNHSTIALGSIVYTTQSNYFISTGVGEVVYNDDTFFAISLGSPIARLLVGKTINETFKFRDKEITITKII